MALVHSAESLMYSCYIWNYLNDLTHIKQHFIAHIYLVISMYKIRGQIFGYRGNATNFKLNIQHCKRYEYHFFMGNFSLIIYLIYKRLNLAMQLCYPQWLLFSLVKTTNPVCDIISPSVQPIEYSYQKFSLNIVSVIY